MNLDQEHDHYFDDSSLCASGTPTAVILMGGVAVGKTMIRRQEYSGGHVLIDVAQIFLDLSRGEILDFPDAFKGELEQLGQLVCDRTFKERRNLVTEIIGDDYDGTVELIDALKLNGYLVNVVGVTCDLATSIERANSRVEDHISAYYAGPINARWIIDALKRVQALR